MLPGIAWGADVRLAIAGSAEYDDNVFRTPDDKKDDLIFRVTPQIDLVEDREKFNYSVGYALPYEIGVTYNDSDEVNDFNHLAHAKFSYRATPQTELFGHDSFYYVQGLFRQQQEVTDPTVADLGDDRERILDNNLTLGVTHDFTPRLAGSLRVRQGVFDTTQFNRANALSFGAVASGAYQLTEQHQLGAGFNYARQMFDDTINRPGSDVDYYNLFGSWQWTFDETTTFSIEAGPALIHSNQDDADTTIADQPPVPYQQVGLERGFPEDDDALIVPLFSNCPVEGADTLLIGPGGSSCTSQEINVLTNPAEVATLLADAPIDYVFPAGFDFPSTSNSRITYFANATLTKRWTPNLASSLGYVRQENTASGVDGGAVLDAVTATTSWRISERWDAAVRADWTLRQSATEGQRQFLVVESRTVGALTVAQVVDGAGLTLIDSDDSLDTQRWGVAARLAYRLTKNTVTALQYAYNKQSSDGNTVGDPSDFDNHLVTFTVQYNFEPIGLPW
jgi:hypothetical protein